MIKPKKKSQSESHERKAHRGPEDFQPGDMVTPKAGPDYVRLMPYGWPKQVTRTELVNTSATKYRVYCGEAGRAYNSSSLELAK